MYHWETIWEFRTRHFLVTFDVTPEEFDPADSFEFAEDIEAVRSSAVDWFTARVAVHLLDGRGDRGAIVGADYLGACAYASPQEFRESHFRSPDDARNTLALKAQNRAICDYFPSMIGEAVKAARQNCAGIPKLRAA